VSIHCASNYPRLKAHSTYDVGLRDGCKDEEYLHVLKQSVNQAIDECKPDFVLCMMLVSMSIKVTTNWDDSIYQTKEYENEIDGF